jgi:two-component system, NtrC family, nitrogen regulation response regulator NtrX
MFYRLSVVPLHVAPLAKRREHILSLVERCLTKIATHSGNPRKQFSPEARRRLAVAQLPRNVCQVRNIVEQYTVLSSSALIATELVHSALYNQPAGL